MLRINPHLQHDAVIEYDDQAHMRETISAQSTFQQVFVTAFKLYPSRPCFGQLRDGAVKYSTYADEYDRIMQITQSLSLVSKPQDRVGISFAGSRLWFGSRVHHQLLLITLFSGTTLSWLPYSDVAFPAVSLMAGRLQTGCQLRLELI